MARQIKNPKRFLALCAVAGIVGGIITAIVVSALFPIIVRDKIESRIASVEKQLGLDIEIEEIKRRGLSGAELRGMTVTDVDNGNVLVRAQVAGASVSLLALLSREIVVTDLWADQVDVVLTETDSGTFDLLEKIANRKRSPKSSDDDDTPDSAPRRSILGDSLPELKTTDINVTFKTRTDLWPIESLTIPEATIDDADSFEVDAVVSISAKESETWSLPTTTTISMQIDQDSLQPVGGNVTFDRPLRISGIGPLPFLVGGFSGVSFDDESNVTIKQPVLDFATVSEKPLFASEDLSFSLMEWTINPREIRVDRLSVNNPRITDHVTKDGRAKSYDIRQIVMPQAAATVRLDAMLFAEKIARKTSEKSKSEEEEDDETTEPPQDADPTANRPNLLAKIAEYLPRSVEVTDASLTVTDDREVELEGWANKLEARDANFVLKNDIENKTFKIESGLKAFADKNSRGAIKANFGWEWDTQKLDADIEISALDLLWFSQLAGPRIANQIRGGILQAKLDVTPDKGRAVKLNGLLSVKKLNVFFEKIAEEPITDFSAGYQFTAKYDPAGKIPEAKLLKKPTLGDHVPADSDLRRGSFEILTGTATVNGVKMSFRPEIYGTAALPRLPARFDLEAKIDELDVQNLVDAVPSAILGPLDGMALAGTFKWQLSLELPLQHAKDMVWKSTPILDEFEITKIPYPADVRRLARDMKIRIKDEVRNSRGKIEPFEKYIYLPTYRAIPSEWIVENMYVTESELLAIRDAHPLPADAGKTTSSSNGTDFHKFVRLTDISPYLTRAIMTTEDKGFWRHSGISFIAMRESLAQNIRAGKIRRGGSTIAMQLIKNVYLDRKKIYARKLREVFMVYLMIHVANIPRDRMLEVYFNVIEFAPRIYGIYDASVHYFGKIPADLTLGEVAFLVSIIPGPKRYHYMWDRGKIPDYHYRRMTRYVNSMFNNEKITEEERDEFLLAPPEFYKPGPDDPPIKPKTVIPILPLDDGPVIPFDL